MMIYFFINITMYLLLLFIIIYYYKDKMTINNFIMILFNMNVFVLFIYQNINFIYGIMVFIISIVISNFISLFNKTNKEIILIKNGNINFHELINNYSYHKLINYLKIHHIHLDEIEYGILKNNKLLIIKSNNTNYPVSIIVDGKLLDTNLKLINKKEKWLNDELIKRNLLIKNIDYAYYKNNNIYFVNNS